MRRGTFLILLAVTMLMAVVALFGLHDGETTRAAPESGELLFPGLAARLDDVAVIAITTPDEQFDIEHGQAGWSLAQRGGYPVRFDVLRKVLVGLGEFRIEQAKTSTPALYDKLGVEDPDQDGAGSVLVRAKDEAGAVLAALIVGKPGRGSSTRYVRREGDSRAWLVEGGFTLPRSPTDWLDRHLPPIEGGRVREVRVLHPDGGSVVVARPDKEEDDWQVQDMPEGYEPVSPTVGRRLGTALESLEFQDVAPAGERELPDEGRVETGFLTYDGLRLVATTAPDGAAFLLRLTVETLPDAEPAVVTEAETLHAKLDPWVFELSSYRASAMRLLPADVMRPIPEPAPEDDAAQPNG